MKEKDLKREEVSRRGFFGAAGKGLALGAGAVVTATGGAQAAVEGASDSDGYRETAHIKTYYDSTRF